MKIFCHFLLSTTLVLSCNGQNTNTLQPQITKSSRSEIRTTFPYGPQPSPEAQVSAYIRRMHQDRSGNYWFGTNGDGVCRYDGSSLVYFNDRDSFGANAVRGMAEDSQGNIWFATSNGVFRFNSSMAEHACIKNTCKHTLLETEHGEALAKAFTHFSTNDGLSHAQVWSILLDKSGTLWAGTEGGLCRFDGKKFIAFPLPVPDLSEFPDAYPAPKLVNCILQDKNGALWFGTNGLGVYRYDGKELIQLSEKDGLCNNFVQCLVQDRNGIIWLGTRFGGASRYDGNSFSAVTAQEGLTHPFIWTFYEDTAGSLWIGTAGGGLYHNEGNAFTNYSKQNGFAGNHVQSILQDRRGRMWFGLSGGLYRLEKKAFVNVLKNGPWD